MTGYDGYAINQWDKFLVCLEQGTLDVDTDLVENMIRPTKLDPLSKVSSAIRSAFCRRI